MTPTLGTTRQRRVSGPTLRSRAAPVPVPSTFASTGGAGPTPIARAPAPAVGPAGRHRGGRAGVREDGGAGGGDGGRGRRWSTGHRVDGRARRRIRRGPR